jgi:transcriptional regulator with XRE-family HTH domain
MARKNDFTEMVDATIGERIHERRLTIGLSRQQLAAKIGVTHQQLQKYEKGTNRIAAGRLAMIAIALKKPVSYFFDELYEIGKLPDKHLRMAIEVSRGFMKIKDQEHQKMVNQLIQSLGAK